MTQHLMGGNATINVTYSADESQANLWTKCGSPAGVVTVVCTINAGVVLYGGSTTIGSLKVPTNFAVGSNITINNLGSIYGQGGDGGQGGDTPSGAGVYGTKGGIALQIFRNVSVSNASGEIFAGGNGGAGGSAGPAWSGGGGGGGQGKGDSSGGAWGTAFPVGLHSDAGHTGNVADRGAGGAAAGDASAGKIGKVWGGYATGSPPQAVDLNANTVTWIDGNDSVHVKGAQS